MKTGEESSRRKFLKQASLLGVSAITSPSELDRVPDYTGEQSGLGYRFLFQGDSITDGNRTRDSDLNHVLGHGYAFLIAAKLGYQLPQKNFHFINRGVSGNQITDLAIRWPEDTIAIKPDLVSILIGVNDAMSDMSGNKSATVLSFENDYRTLLTKTIRELPDVKLVICEPFLLPVGKIKDSPDRYMEAIGGRQAVARKIAEEFRAVYVPLQGRFTNTTKKYPPDSYWLWDGVHPMPNGHELIALEWIHQVSRTLKFIG